MLNFAYFTSFQKNYIGWPQQPPTDKILKFNLKFHHFHKVLVHSLSKDLLFSYSKSFHVFTRKVDASTFHCIFTNITKDIGELKSNS